MRSFSRGFASLTLLTCAVALSGKDYVADFPAEVAAWQQNGENIKASVSGQSLILEGAATDKTAFTVLDKAPVEGAVEITARFRLLNAGPDRRVALIWQAGATIYSYFELIDTGNYSLYDWTPKTWIHQRVTIETAQAKQGEFNELKVRWLNGRAFFTLNGVTVDFVDMPEPRLSQIGFYVASGAKVEIESLTARALPSAAGELAALAQKLTDEAKVQQKAAGVVTNLNAPLPFPYVEEFDHNDAGWTVKADKLELGFRDGAYEFENLSAEANNANWVSKNLPQAITGDFEIAVTMSRLEGGAEAKAGLIFDLDGTWARRALNVSSKGYHYYSYDGKAWRDERAYQEVSPLVKAGADATNTVAVRVVGGRAYCLINGVAVQSFDYPKMERLGVGLIVTSGTSVRFERMEVKPLTFASAARTAEMQRLEEQARTERIATGPKREDWVEDFNDNQRGWTLQGDAQYKPELKNGEIVANNLNTKGTRYDVVTLPLNQLGDYDLSLRGRFLGGNVSDIVALVWGNASDGSEHNRFCFYGDTNWNVYRRVGENRQNIVPWTKTTAIKPNGQMNEIVLRKVDDTYFFIINGQVLGDLPAFKVGGDRIGFEIGAGVQGAVDQIKLTYPNRTYAESLREKESLFKTLATNHAKKGLGVVYTVEVKKEEEAAKGRAQEMLRKENDEILKLSQKYYNKQFLKLVVDRGLRSYAKREGNIFYYSYKTIGGKHYYLQVICSRPDTNRMGDADLYVSSIFLREGPI